MSATLPKKEALAHVLAEIDAVVLLVEASVEKYIPYGEYAPLARRLNALVQKALDAGCVELPGGPYGEGRTSLPIYTLREGVVISPQEFTLWKGRILKLRREAQGLLDSEPGPKEAPAEPPAEPDPAASAVTAATSRARGTVHQRILEQLHCDPQSAQWSQRDWAKYLGCCASAVAKAPAWQTVKATRAMEQVDRLDQRRGRRR